MLSYGVAKPSFVDVPTNVLLNSDSVGGDFGDSLEWNSAQVVSTWSRSC